MFLDSQKMHPVLQKLYSIIRSKQSNLAVSADLTKSKVLLDLVEKVGPHICVLKTHIDIVEDFTPELTRQLRALADQYNFLIFEDRKFADIGNTVKHQVRDGMYKIAQWADIINAHILPGEGIISGLKEGCQGQDVGLLLLAQMSSKGNFFSENYTQSVVKLAQQNRDFVMGFIAQEQLVEDDHLITMTPGVQLSPGGDILGQNYNTPDYVVGEKKSDIIIVGRGIYAASDPASAAERYRRASWDVFNSRKFGR